ncbi:hypothetical protein DFP73DRAFT_276245 [Morchella snyderi]|nr:hypothetical protein DFP73DRAFT_276245 [Morchella snyderi]
MPPHSYEQLTAHCNLYFARPPEEWSYTSFAEHFAAALGRLKFDVLNFRWTKNLSVIAQSPLQSRDRRRKARSLLDAARSSAQLRRDRGAASKRPPPVHQQTIVNGDIIQTGGVKINEVSSELFVAGGSGGVTVERLGAKRRAQGGGVAAGKRRMRGGPAEAAEGSTQRTRADEAEVEAEAGAGTETETETETGAEADAEVDAEAESVAASPQTPSTPPPAGPFEAPPHPADHSSLPSSPASPHPPYMDDPYSSFPPFPYDPLFVTTYLSIAPSQKHAFTTARTLEDVVYHHVRTTPARTPWLHNNPILQWIIDLSDPVVSRWFSSAERAEIAAWGPGLPDRDAAFEYAVGRFPTSPKCKAELYDIIDTPSRPPGEEFDERRHATALYANNTASSMYTPLSPFPVSPLTPPATDSRSLPATHPAPGSAPRTSAKAGSPLCGRRCWTAAYTPSPGCPCRGQTSRARQGVRTTATTGSCGACWRTGTFTTWALSR